jgi:uncharacterized membrane protein YeaQ/YmgE (transglycosylase-associated protein family)
MSIIAWIVLGLISGFIASRIVDNRGEGFLVDIVLGVVGAVAGGFVFHLFGSSGVTGFNVRSLFVSVTGAVLVLLTYRAISRRRRSD